MCLLASDLLWFSCRPVATSSVGRFILTVMDGLGKMDRTCVKEQMHFHDKTRVGMFLFRWSAGGEGGGEGEKKVLFLLRSS